MKAFVSDELRDFLKTKQGKSQMRELVEFGELRTIIDGHKRIEFMSVTNTYKSTSDMKSNAYFALSTMSFHYFCISDILLMTLCIIA